MNIFDCRSRSWNKDWKPISIGDNIAVIGDYGNKIYSIVTKANVYGECSDSCPYVNLGICHMMPCDNLTIFKAVSEEYQVTDDTKFTLKSIKGKVCNLDICMYYEENCRRYEMEEWTNSNFCLLRRIIK